MNGRKKTPSYSADMAGRMYKFFLNYNEAGAPSFGKFAISIGVTLSDLQRFRKNKNFDRAYRECREIRRDYLIDKALERRFDPSFTKYLISLEDEERDEGEDSLLLRLEVKE